MGTTIGVAQGMCPMCAGMGLGMLLFWLVVLVLIAVAVWLVVRRVRRPR